MNDRRYFRFIYDRRYFRFTYKLNDGGYGDIFVDSEVMPSKSFIKKAIYEKNHVNENLIIFITNIYEFKNKEDYLEFQE